MILVDVFVPSIDRTYNFSLDENVALSVLVEELIELVERKEQTSFAGNRTTVSLISGTTRRVLPPHNTLKECGVPTGSTLLLV